MLREGFLNQSSLEEIHSFYGDLEIIDELPSLKNFQNPSLKNPYIATATKIYEENTKTYYKRLQPKLSHYVRQMFADTKSVLNSLEPKKDCQIPN